MKKLNVGIIGFGLSGRVFHAPILSGIENLHLSKIYTRSSEKQHQARQLYPEAIVVDTMDDVLGDAAIDLVVLCLPNIYHFDLAKKALQAGKHVVVEKPFTVTSEEAVELIDLSKRHDRLLSVYHNRRFDSDFLTVQKILQSKTLGNLKEFESHFDRFRNRPKENAWREEPLPGSGMLYDLGSHLIDQAVTLFGLPNEVYADIQTQRSGGKVDDNFALILYYNDLKVTLKTSMLVKEPLPRFILLGDNGTFLKYGFDPQEDALKAGQLPADMDRWGMEPIELHGTINYLDGDATIKNTVVSEIGDYRKYYENIYAAISGRAELAVTAEQARDVIRIIESAQRSHLEKRRIEL